MNVLYSDASGNLSSTSDLGVNYLTTTNNISSGKEISASLGDSSSQFRAKHGNYGTMLRQDGSDFYILNTANGDPNGSWNAQRPFYINNASGNVGMAHNVNVGGALSAGSISTSGNVNTSIVNASGVNASGWSNFGSGHATDGSLTIEPNSTINGTTSPRISYKNKLDFYQHGTGNRITFEGDGATIGDINIYKGPAPPNLNNDGADYNRHQGGLSSWWGIGLKSTCAHADCGPLGGGASHVFNTRNGDLKMKGSLTADGNISASTLNVSTPLIYTRYYGLNRGGTWLTTDVPITYKLISMSKVTHSGKWENDYIRAAIIDGKWKLLGRSERGDRNDGLLYVVVSWAAPGIIDSNFTEN